jgi:hypothetical protein
VEATTERVTIEELVQLLGSAREAATEVAGEPPLGVRAVEPAAGRRGYLCAFDGPRFLCLDARLAPERDLRRARQAASAGLLWEHVETLVDAAALQDLAEAIGRLLAQGGDPPAVTATLEVVAARALELLAWREDPVRALASLPDTDTACRIQERLVGAYRRFVRASEPLVEVQDTLPAPLLQSLVAVEEAAGRAGAAERLAEALARAMPDCEEGAEQMMASHVTRLRG